MPGINHTLKGSTLAETLVMMLVAGIVFLSVMDALTLFTRMQAQRTEALLAAGRAADGYYRVASLAASADSAGRYGDGVELFRSGRRMVLALRDSALLYVEEQFRDTLLMGVETIRLAECDPLPDTLEVGFAAGFTAKFSIPESRRNVYERSLEELEHEYGYEEE